MSSRTDGCGARHSPPSRRRPPPARRSRQHASVSSAGSDARSVPAPAGDSAWVPASVHPEISPAEFKRFVAQQSERALERDKDRFAQPGGSDMSASCPGPDVAHMPSSRTAAAVGPTGELDPALTGLIRSKSASRDPHLRASLITRSTSLSRRASKLRKELNPDRPGAGTGTDPDTDTDIEAHPPSPDLPKTRPSDEMSLRSGVQPDVSLSPDDLARLGHITDQASETHDPVALRHALQHTISLSRQSAAFDRVDDVPPAEAQHVLGPEPVASAPTQTSSPTLTSTPTPTQFPSAVVGATSAPPNEAPLVPDTASVEAPATSYRVRLRSPVPDTTGDHEGGAGQTGHSQLGCSSDSDTAKPVSSDRVAPQAEPDSVLVPPKQPARRGPVSIPAPGYANDKAASVRRASPVCADGRQMQSPGAHERTRSVPSLSPPPLPPPPPPPHGLENSHARSLSSTDVRKSPGSASATSRASKRKSRYTFASWFGARMEEEVSRRPIKVERKGEKSSAGPDTAGESAQLTSGAGIFASLFGKKRAETHVSEDTQPAMEELSPTSASQTSPGVVPVQASQVPYRVSGPTVDHYARFPLPMERAIYRLGHLKLAYPRRSLWEQVLITNLMLSVIDLTSNAPTPIAAGPQVSAPYRIPSPTRVVSGSHPESPLQCAPVTSSDPSTVWLQRSTPQIQHTPPTEAEDDQDDDALIQFAVPVEPVEPDSLSSRTTLLPSLGAGAKNKRPVRSKSVSTLEAGAHRRWISRTPDVYA